MTRSFIRPSAVLSTLPVSRYSTLERAAQRQTHDVLRQSVERLWHPFTAARHGADIKAYRFPEHLAEICTAGNTFTCQVNGQPGGKRVLEDFFTTLITGFDLVQVNVESVRGNSLSQPRDLHNYRGQYVLQHTRPFLGWQPSPSSLRMPATAYRNTHGSPLQSGAAYSSVDVASSAAAVGVTESFFPPVDQREVATVTLSSAGATAAAAAAVEEGEGKGNTSMLVVPFTTYVEGVLGSGRLSHLVLRSPVMELLSSCAECPEEVRTCLQSKEAMKMFVTLRRAGVKPEMITAKTLLSASKQNEVWTAALGIL